MRVNVNFVENLDVFLTIVCRFEVSTNFVPVEFAVCRQYLVEHVAGHFVCKNLLQNTPKVSICSLGTQPNLLVMMKSWLVKYKSSSSSISISSSSKVCSF